MTMLDHSHCWAFTDWKQWSLQLNIRALTICQYHWSPRVAYTCKHLCRHYLSVTHQAIPYTRLEAFKPPCIKLKSLETVETMITPLKPLTHLSESDPANFNCENREKLVSLWGSDKTYPNVDTSKLALCQTCESFYAFCILDITSLSLCRPGGAMRLKTSNQQALDDFFHDLIIKISYDKLIWR